MSAGAPDVLPAILLAALGVAFAVFWIVALIDLVRRDDKDFPSAQPGSNPRLVWSVVVVLLGGVGGFVYYLRVMRPYPRRR